MKSWRRYLSFRLLSMPVGLVILSYLISGQISMASEVGDGQT